MTRVVTDPLLDKETKITEAFPVNLISHQICTAKLWPPDRTFLTTPQRASKSIKMSLLKDSNLKDHPEKGQSRKKNSRALISQVFWTNAPW